MGESATVYFVRLGLTPFWAVWSLSLCGGNCLDWRSCEGKVLAGLRWSCGQLADHQLSPTVLGCCTSRLIIFMLRVSRPLLSSLSTRCYSTHLRFVTTNCHPFDDQTGLIDLNVDEPAILKNNFRDVPAVAKWFSASATSSSSLELDTRYLEQYGDSVVPLELTRISSDKITTFERFEAPLSLLLAHMTSQSDSSISLYLAQHSLADLPPALQADLPTPSILSLIGRGDIYASSLWMGRPPTRTPLHRDPNPNLFVQLAGQKVVRLMRPEVGRRVYEKVKMQIGSKAGRATMRGEEMMEGEEMEALERAVWDEESAYDDVGGVEARLDSGDGLYIPLGWWHAIHGVGSGANASVCISEGFVRLRADLC
jgi:hypothetical protein